MASIYLKCLFISVFAVSVAIEGELDWLNCKPDKICERVFCPDLSNCVEPNMEVVKKGGLCGCCDTCVRLLNKGASCTPIAKPAGLVENVAKCMPGLKCHETDERCVEEDEEDKLPICLRVRKMREEIQQNDLYDLPFRKDLWMPECDEKGFFKAKQCKDKKCMCLAKNGERLFGNAEVELSANMTCGCSVAVHEDRMTEPQAWMTKAHFRCTKTGDYEELQCYENLCYCADQKTGKPKGAMVLIDHHEFLPCYKQRSAKELTYLTKCEKQEIRESKMFYEFYQKGIVIDGFKTVTCDLDGSFSARQCDPQACYCTDRNATSLRSYKIDRAAADELKMTCRCARDEHDNEANFARFPTLRCGNMGQFEYHQCNGKDCFCADEDGDYITEAVLYQEELTNQCRELRVMLELEAMLREINQFGYAATLKRMLTTTTQKSIDIATKK